MRPVDLKRNAYELTTMQVDDVICTALIGARPKSHEPCNGHECPAWFEGPWSEVRAFHYLSVPLE